MINSIPSTKKINSFEFVAIPSPRDVFNRYGERVSNSGEFSCGAELGSAPVLVSSGSVIDQMVNAESYLNSSVNEQQL